MGRLSIFSARSDRVQSEYTLTRSYSQISSGIRVLDVATVKPDELEFVEAFEAQGLLSLVADLLERLSSSYLLSQLETLLETFSLYLAHPASTVRQACSSLFFQLAAKSDSGPSRFHPLLLSD